METVENMPAYGEAETCSPLSVISVHAVEAFKDAFNILGRNNRPLVGYAENNLSVGKTAGSIHDASLIGEA